MYRYAQTNSGYGSEFINKCQTEILSFAHLLHMQNIQIVTAFIALLALHSVQPPPPFASNQKTFISTSVFPLSQLRIKTGKCYLRIQLLLKDKIILKMKNFNILGLHWKIWLLGGGFTKNQYRRGRGGYLKRRARTVCWFKGGLAGKRGWCFWGVVNTPMHTMQ